MWNLQRQKLRRLWNGSDQAASCVELQDSTVAVPIGDEHLPGCGHGRSRRLTQVASGRTWFKATSDRNAGIVMVRHKLERLVQCHIREPHVPIAVDRHPVWHVEDSTATFVDHLAGLGTQRQDRAVFNRTLHDLLEVVGLVEAPANS